MTGRFATMSRDQRIQAEAQALWRELFDEPAPPGGHGGDMIARMLSRLPAPGYERLASPFLRRSQVAEPRRR